VLFLNTGFNFFLYPHSEIVVAFFAVTFAVWPYLDTTKIVSDDNGRNYSVSANQTVLNPTGPFTTSEYQLFRDSAVRRTCTMLFSKVERAKSTTRWMNSPAARCSRSYREHVACHTCATILKTILASFCRYFGRIRGSKLVDKRTQRKTYVCIYIYMSMFNTHRTKSCGRLDMCLVRSHVSIFVYFYACRLSL